MAFLVSDFSPVENLWSIMKNMAHKHNQKNLQELEDEIIENLCASFLVRVTKYIAQQGDCIGCLFIYIFFYSNFFFVDCI
jgi:hypothetical protein